jgi:two-component system, sensor histidine kinase and response regulator
LSEKTRLEALSLFSYVVIALSVVVCLVGGFLYISLGRLGTELPVQTIDQFRNLSSLMPLVSEVESDLNALSAGEPSIAWKNLDFTLEKLKVAERAAAAGFGDGPPAQLGLIMQEVDLISQDLSRLDRSRGLDVTRLTLYRTRVDYIYSELRDYVLRVNNDTLIELAGQRRDIGRLRAALLVSSAIALFAAALTFALQRSRRRLFAGLEEQRAAAVASSRAKSEFLSNMSHEIRTPMNAIIGLSYLALKTSLTPSQSDYLRRIQGSGQHLLGIINDILDFSKIEAGKLSLENIPFELEKVMDNVANLTAEKASAKGLELIFIIDEVVPRRLVGDPLRLGQILVNYANNAVKFTEKGEIAVQVGVSREEEGRVLLRFEVRDTGIGVSAEQQERLFRSFQQADGSVTRRYGGTGLGLAICKDLAGLMGGEVGLTSAAGAGSTFWFTAWLGRGEGARRRFLPAPDLRGRRVLVADDNENARLVIQGMLRGMTFETAAVASGPAALAELGRAAAAGRPYDVVLVDWQMPEMDGLETVRRLRTGGISPSTHAVIITAYGLEDVIREAEAEGVQSVLIKPVSPSILFDAIMHILGAAKAVPRGKPPVAAAEHDSGIQGARVLLVEDNDVNQMVATEILQRAGCVVSVAGDGREAVRRTAEAGFDCVLMDVQMPVMDGLAATREIRAAGRAGLPIIAMTANAMTEDRQACFDAGMNDYVTKPIDPDAMIATLRRHCRPRAGEPEAGAHDAKPAAAARVKASADDGAPSIPGIDTEGGLRRVGGNRRLYRELLERFVEGQREAPRRLRDALAGGDSVLARRIAHTLKGVAGTIGAGEAQAAAAELEALIAEGRPGSETGPAAQRLDRIVAAAVAGLEAGITALGPWGAPARPGQGAEQSFTDTLAELARCLRESDFQAVSILESAREELKAALGEAGFRGLESSLHSFDFAAALEAVLAVSAGGAPKPPAPQG